MSRRLLTAGFVLAVLWCTPSGFGRVAANPPEPPIVGNNIPSLFQPAAVGSADDGLVSSVWRSSPVGSGADRGIPRCG